MAATAQASLSPIEPGVLYPLPLFKQITGFGNHAMRTARANGLKVRRLGGRAFVHGTDFLGYVDSLDRQENGETGE